MGFHRSYFNKNNTLLFNSDTNTGRNPIIDLYFGQSKENVRESGFSRYIFNIDLDLLKEKISDGIISTGCSQSMTHTLNLINTITFNEDFINSFNSDNRKRASSFDLILFRIPLTSGNTGNLQDWDEGVGYDYSGKEVITSRPYGFRVIDQPKTDRAYSDRPSNWYKTTNISNWSEPGIYDNTNNSNLVNYSSLTIIDEQHFDTGNENISFDMTDEINGILDGTITNVAGWGIAFKPDIENITGLTASYSVSFFSRHAMTFYQPYLQTKFDDIITDDRNNFVENRINKLYLYVHEDGDFKNLDENPTVTILDHNGDEIVGFQNLPTCLKTKGVYEVTIPTLINYPTPCQFTDVWKNIKVSTDYGNDYPDVEQSFILRPVTSKVTTMFDKSNEDEFSFNFYGINNNEKILNKDIRKIGVNIRKAFTTNHSIPNVSVSYKCYVLEGKTKVLINDWELLSKTDEEYYTLFDTRDKIPNEYFIDLKISHNGTVKTYNKILTFEIVPEK